MACKIGDIELSSLDIKNFLEGPLRKLSSTYRYSTVRCNRVESVAEHSWYVAKFSIVLAKLAEDAGHEIDYRRLFLSSVNHDLGEACTGDLLSHLKRNNSDLKKLMDRLEFEGLRSLLEDLKCEYILEYVMTAKDTSRVEGWIIKLCDLLSVVSYSAEEIKVGNSFFKAIMAEAQSWIVELSHKDGFPDFLKPVVTDTIKEYQSLAT